MTEKTREYYEEEKRKFENEKSEACKQLERLEIDRTQLLGESLRESVEKETLDKHKTMVSDAEKHINTISNWRKAVAAEEKKLRQKKFYGE